MKWIIRIVLLLVIVALIGVGALVYYVDSLAKRGIEQGGTYALGVETTIEKADVQILGGAFDMGNFKVANPGGYKTPHFMHLDDGGVAVSFGTLREDIVELPHLTLTGLNIFVEEKDGKKNLDVILANVNSKVGGGEKEPTEEPAEDGKKFVVKEIIIKDVNMGIAMAPLGTADKPYVVHVPEIRLENVGSDGSGVDMGHLIGIITQATMKSIVSNLGDNVPAAILGSLNGSMDLVGGMGDFGGEVVGDVTELGQQAIGQIGEGAGKAIEGAGEKIKEGVGEIGEGAEKAIDGAGKAIQEGVGGLLGGDKKKEEDKEDGDATKEDTSDDSTSDAADKAKSDNPLDTVGKGIGDVGKGIGDGIGGLLGGDKSETKSEEE